MTACELVNYYKSKQLKTAVIYTVILLILLTSAVIIEFGIKFPDPMDLVQKIVTFITGDKEIQ